MPAHERLGSDDMKDLEDGRKQSIELDEDPPIEVGQTNPAPALTAQHEQLVPQDRILRLKPRVRSTRREPESTRGARSSDQLTPFGLLLNGMRFRYRQGRADLLGEETGQRGHLSLGRGKVELNARDSMPPCAPARSTTKSSTIAVPKASLHRNSI